MLKEKPLIIQYLNEYGREYFENEDGFFTYSFEENVMCVWDVFIKPDRRNIGNCKKLFETTLKFAADKGCESIEGYVDKEYDHKERSILMLQALGFNYYKETEECIWFRRIVS